MLALVSTVHEREQKLPLLISLQSSGREGSKHSPLGSERGGRPSSFRDGTARPTGIWFTVTHVDCPPGFGFCLIDVDAGFPVLMLFFCDVSVTSKSTTST